jgi:hypothetical protein
VRRFVSQLALVGVNTYYVITGDVDSTFGLLTFPFVRWEMM